jgi:GMP synthase (glutamine-hydrolysing)
MTERLRVVITEHASGRTDGILDLVDSNGASGEIIKLHQGERLPDADSCDAVISAGGPMGIYEMNLPQYDFLQREADFIAEMIAKGKAVLGICLGHQLLTHVLGGKVVNDPRRAETGWTRIALNQSGQHDELFKEVPGAFWSFEYHNDQVVRIPSDCFLLASTPLCGIQSFRYSSAPVWGVQFHPEISPEKAKSILESRRDILKVQGVDIFLAIDQGFQVPQQPRKQIFYNFINFIRS